MKIAFRIDFGDGIGMGHLTRMTALADAFSQYNAQSVFFNSSDEPVDYSGFDIVVLDSYMLTSGYIDGLNKIAPFVVCYDDNALYEYSCDVVVNANLHAGTLDFKFGEKKPKLLLGGQYALLRKEFWNAEPITIKKKANRILLTFGGTDINDITETILTPLAELKEYEIIAVFGPVAKGYDRCKKRFQNSQNVVIYKDPSSMAEVMRRCDIAVSAGGSALYELAAIGMPALIIPQADNQLRACEFFTNEGFMKSIGWWEDIYTDVLVEETVLLASDFERRKRESRKMRKCVNPKGALLLAETILNIKNETA